jgi:hypothetical protein
MEGAVLPKACSYRIEIEGRLDPRWSSWFNGMTIEVEDRDPDLFVTILDGAVPDQASLRGILNKIWDLNLSLISVNRLDFQELEND